MFEEQTRNMIRSVIRTLTERGQLSNKQEALQKLQDHDWVEEHGYGHISHILNSDSAVAECRHFFDELEEASMRKLIEGIHEFRSSHFLSQKELFERLASSQAPDALFITCSDSRIVPNLITQTEPGDLFLIRNAGNIMPPAGSGSLGEAATMEFAVKALHIKDIIVCGHSNCGAMKGLIEPAKLKEMPLVAEWLKYAETTKQIIEKNYADATEEEKIEIAIQENVLVQMENIRTYPYIAQALNEGTITLHGWVYQIHTGIVFAYYPEHGQFMPIGEKHALTLSGNRSQRESI